MNCSLFYFALKQRTVLRNLWRLATWHPEQRATYKLLSNDFDEPKWQKAAQKNAYALLSKRRYRKFLMTVASGALDVPADGCEGLANRWILSNTKVLDYAAAFFLLGDSLEDAVNVCVDRLNDLQLAIAIARVYEGDEGPVLRRLLEEEVLMYAAQEGNRWLASWAFWMLNRKDMAVRALIVRSESSSSFSLAVPTLLSILSPFHARPAASITHPSGPSQVLNDGR